MVDKHIQRNIMRIPLPALLMLSAFFLGVRGCPDVTESPSVKGKISVYVHWQETPLEGKKVELLETHDVGFTQTNGIAEFWVQPGIYTVRIYDINKGGPCCAYVDEEVTLVAGESKQLDIVDCLLCV
jgi:hypothetical protein